MSKPDIGWIRSLWSQTSLCYPMLDDFLRSRYVAFCSKLSFSHGKTSADMYRTTFTLIPVLASPRFYAKWHQPHLWVGSAVSGWGIWNLETGIFLVCTEYILHNLALCYSHFSHYGGFVFRRSVICFRESSASRRS